ncbi:MAG: NAD(P)/FAD-dependent oxidoreductase [Asgard group archaeon]|nr:NAD(P)/FAD-dependent oxidoreductase [Asgard group archaeon]
MSKKKPKPKPNDVIIVGAGIAGCVLAFHLATADRKVIVFEKKTREEMGPDWCDSVEKEAFSFSGIPPPKGKEKKAERDHAAILSPDFSKIIHLDSYNQWIVDRKLLHERLVGMAEKAGAEFVFETEIVEPMGKGQWVVGVKKKDGKVENARLIVDCSGEERILGKNIEILDLNLKLPETDIVDAYRELHKVDSKDIEWGGHKIEQNVLYYRYGYEKGYSWLNFEDLEHLDIGAGVGKGFSNRSAKAIVNDYINSNKEIQKEKLRGGGGKIVVRRPLTLVWYGFMMVGEAAAQVLPSMGFGTGSSMKAAKIAAEVALKALQRKELSIDGLWEYQVRYIKERGRDVAALDMMRNGLQQFSEEEASFLINKGIFSKNDFEKLINAKYPKVNIFKQIDSMLKGISRPKLMWKMRKVAQRSNKIFSHYRKMPKEYDSKKYLAWMLGHMHLFEEIRKE